MLAGFDSSLSRKDLGYITMGFNSFTFRRILIISQLTGPSETKSFVPPWFFLCTSNCSISSHGTVYLISLQEESQHAVKISSF